MQIIIDDWWEMLTVGLIIIVILFIVYLIIKLIINNGGIRMKNLKLGQQKDPLLLELKETLITMEEERKKARLENSEFNKATQKMIKALACTSDAILEALQVSKIGNGNLEKARKSLSFCYDVQDDYLVNQL